MKQIFTFLILLIFILNGYKISAQTEIVKWNFPSGSANYVADGGLAANSTKVISTTATGAVSFIAGAGGAGDSAIRSLGWDNGMDVKYWLIEFETNGYKDIKISSKQRSSNTGPKNFKLQYMLGSSGTWTDVLGATNIVVADNFTLGVLSNIVLPSDCDNQASISLRWIMTTNTSVANLTVASGGASRIDDIIVTGTQVTSDAEILTFDIPGQVSSLVTSVGATVDIVMPYGTDVTALVPSITVSAGATISPLTGVAQDFTSSVPYTVTAGDGTTTKTWTVTVNVLSASNAAEIVSFDIPTQASSTINTGLATVDIIMPMGTDVTALIPSITISAGATISPLTGVVQDFTNPVIYTVTAEDGTTIKTWTVTVTLQLSALAEILTFDIPSQVSSTISSIPATIDIVMPFGTDVTALIPAITISTNATVSPLTGVAQDFTSSVVYAVTAEDGTTVKNWTVTVTVQPASNAAEILTFDIPLQISSTINSGPATIDLVFPTGTDVTALIPTITISTGATISPLSGVAQDFTTPVTYIVTAEDGTPKNWTATVTFVDIVVPIVLWNFPNNPDDSIADGGIAANLTKLIITNSAGTVGFASAGATTNSARNTGWTGGLDTKYWEVEFTTEGYKNITLASKQRSSSTGPKDFKIQYKIGIGGTWVDVPSAVIATAADWTTGVLPEMTLPTATFNKTSVYLRWIMASNLAVGGGNVVAAGASNIDDIIVNGVAVTVSDAAEIITFDIPTQVSSVVNSTDATVNIVMPYGTDVTALVPTITYSANATIAPASGVVQDFTSPVNYLVTAQDGITTRIWTVTVSLSPAPSNEAEILTFNIPTNVSSTITSVAATVDVLMPIGTDVTALIPTIAVSTGATISPLSGIAQDFTAPVTYIVTAEDGSTTKIWTVTVNLVIAPISIVDWTFPNNPDDSIADGGITANLTKCLISNTGDLLTYIPSGATGATTSCARSLAWDSGMDTKYWLIEFTTSGYQDITLSSRQRSSNTGPVDFKTQYRIGTAGTWTDISNGAVIVANDFTTGILTDVSLPIECENQSSVYVRWIMTSDVAVAGGTVAAAGASNIDDIIVKGLLITNNNETGLNKSFSFNVYPNPSHERTIIHVNNDLSSKVKIEILSLEGRIMYQNEMNSSSLEININSYNSGIYIIKAISGDEVIVQKLVKQ